MLRNIQRPFPQETDSRAWDWVLGLTRQVTQEIEATFSHVALASLLAQSLSGRGWLPLFAIARRLYGSFPDTETFWQIMRRVLLDLCPRVSSREHLCSDRLGLSPPYRILHHIRHTCYRHPRPSAKSNGAIANSVSLRTCLPFLHPFASRRLAAADLPRRHQSRQLHMLDEVAVKLRCSYGLRL